MAQSMMAEREQHALTKEVVSSILDDGILPGNWNVTDSKLTYGILSESFELLESLGLPQSKIITLCARLCNLDEAYIGSIIKKPCNFKKGINRFLSKSPDNFNVIFEKFYTNEINIQQVIGASLSKHNIDFDILKSINNGCNSLPPNFSPVSLTNENLLDLLVAKELFNSTWNNVREWVVVLSGILENEVLSHDSLRKRVMKIKEKAAELIRHQNQTELQHFLSIIFDFSTKIVQESINTSSENEAQESGNANRAREQLIKNLLEKIDNYEDSLEYLLNEHNHMKQEKAKEKKETEGIRQKLELAREKIETMNEKLREAFTKISEFQVRNVNRRIKRLNDKVQNAENTIMEQEGIINDLTCQTLENTYLNEQYEKEIDLLHENLDKALRDKLCEQRLKWYYKDSRDKEAAKTDDESTGINRSKIKELNARICELENEKEEIERKLDIFTKGEEVCLFKDGKYVDEVRMLYEDLLCMGVSTRNVEGVIRQVLKHAAGVNVGRLPKATFAKYMLLEARALSQMQVADELSRNWDTENRTLQTDGTSKKGRSFITYDIVKDDGQLLIAGLREVSGGDSATQLKVLEDVLADVTEMFKQCSDGENSCSDVMGRIIKSIKNVMSDRCAVQKQFNDLFTCYRKDVLPTVLTGWDSLTDDEKAKLSTVNQFFCGLHFLVGLADQAEACCKVWDSLCWENQKVGSIAEGGYSNGDSGVYRLIRTVCKSVQERGCEKSGRMVQFQTFLKTEKGIDTIPLAPFFGNRFNILFHNAAGTYFLEEELKEFFQRVSKENKLLSAVHQDLQVPTYLAACRALGMVDKLITGPLWRIIAKEGHVLDMNVEYQKLKDCYKSWAVDASEFMKGDAVIFGDKVKINKDEIFECLFLSRDKDFDEMTKQCLEVIFSGFQVVTERLLGAHLDGGALSAKANDPQFRNETKSVAKSNVAPERDFGMLDFQMKLKPKATDFAIEGLIMFKENRTSDWRSKLTKERRTKLMEVARKSKKLQMEKLRSTKQKILIERAQKVKDKLEEKEKKERNQRIMKEGLHAKIEEVGLWKTGNEIKDKVNKITGIVKKREAIWQQIQFRNKVLGNTHEDRSLFQLTSAGKAHSVSQLIDNLIKIIEKLEQEKNQPEEEISQLKTGPSIILDKTQFLKEKTKFLKQLEPKQKQATNIKRKQQSPVTQGKKQKVDEKTYEELPIISRPEDLIGKRICQKFDDEDGAGMWYYGTVLSGGSGKNPLYEIKYDDDENKILRYRLMEDWESGDLVLVPLAEMDLEEKTIMHLYTDEASGEDCWYKAWVAGIDDESEDMDNPDFFVRYLDDDMKDGESADSDDYFLCNLFGDYANGWVRIVS